MLELTRNYRAENVVDFKELITDLRIVKNGGKPDLKHMEKLNVENHYVGPIKLQHLLIINGCKKNQGVNYIIVNNFKIFVGLPIISKKTMTVEKIHELKNNEKIEVILYYNKKR
jgi:hypothetical protein